MYITKENLAKYPEFHQAVQLCELMGMSWRSIYVDPSYELAITFKGTLSKEQVKNVIMHFCDLLVGECDSEAIKPELYQDYRYKDFSGQETEVYTPDDWSFERLIPVDCEDCKEAELPL